MKCPVCKETSLVIADRQGIEIDYCPQCRGVWLDRGELDKLIERSATAFEAAPVRQESVSDRDRRPDYRDDDRYRGDHRHKKRKGFLGELFDFD